MPTWSIPESATPAFATREARRIWLNLDLVKKPVQCLEYIIVHEMVHLLEKDHSERFAALMLASCPSGGCIGKS